jgi:phenylacetate-coenzyme A ligase PaaK-like adenylate-forming protein
MESWIAQRLAVPEESLTRASIAQYQLTALQQTVAFARSHSSFYDHRLRGLACDLPRSLDEFASLPLTSPVDLTEHTPGFLCVPQDKVSRIVTLHGRRSKARLLYR